ncbi:tetratricopeptide repeat protein [Ectothiorhodospiraceae bacterium WFHF3C12]|nr:tetratricopeptide repeat protein [Ectothiorhodospiraceae bacterium WFHF3C12]
MVTRTDEEQVEALTRWWRENGRSVIGALILAVAGVLGYQQWQSYQTSQAELASALYQQFNAAETTEAAAETFATLQADHDSSPYAVLAAMSLAQRQVEDGALERAAELLRWAAEEADDAALERLATLRLARVLWAAGDHQQATEALGEPPEGGYVSEYYELRGDILAAQSQHADAADAYRMAIEEASALGPQRRQLLQMKLDSAGGAAPKS